MATRLFIFYIIWRYNRTDIQRLSLIFLCFRFYFMKCNFQWLYFSETQLARRGKLCILILCLAEGRSRTSIYRSQDEDVRVLMVGGWWGEEGAFTSDNEGTNNATCLRCKTIVIRNSLISRRRSPITPLPLCPSSVKIEKFVRGMVR